MKQAMFEARHEAEWARLEQWLQVVETGRSSFKHKPVPGADRARAVSEAAPEAAAGTLADIDMPAAYRRICQHLAMAERRGYSATLIDRLRALVHRGHLRLYRAPTTRWRAALEFLARGFPRLVREQRGPMLAASVLFFVPFILSIVVLQFRPELSSLVLPPDTMAEVESMYDPTSERLGRARASESNLYMFGHYIFNNVTIGFRTFASGLIVCLGSVFVLVFNGVFLGSVAGHLTAIGSGDPFWRFVAGHSAPELLGIVISGGAGLQLGLALIAPGQRTRARAFREAGLVGARIIMGVLALLVFAAFVEAFWSSIAWMPALVKYAVGTALWVALLAWLLRAGRGDGGRHAH